MTLKDESPIIQYKRLQRCYREKSIDMLQFESAGQLFDYRYRNTDLK